MSRLVLIPDRVFDSVNGTMLNNHQVVIEDDRVVAVEPARGEGQRLQGQTILPGLMDVHTHLASPPDSGRGYTAVVERTSAQDVLFGVHHASITLRAGFTSVRDVGTWRAFTDVALRDAIDAGWVEGPRMMVAGAYVTCPGGGGDITGLAPDIDEVLPRELRFGVASGVEDIRTTSRQILRYGANLIKIMATGAVLTPGTKPGAPEMTEEELRAAVEIATDNGTHVAAHAHGTEGIKRAVRAGVRSIEHGSMLDPEAIGLMVGRGTYLSSDLYDSDYIREVGPALGYTDEVMRKNELTADAQRKSFRAAVEAGVKIAYGTDAGVYPHGNNARQFSLYVTHGLSPAGAIQSATRWAADLMGWEDRVGSLRSGMYADLVVVDGNPLDDVTLLESPAAVMKGGVWVSAPDGP